MSDDFVGTMPVRDRHQFDVAALEGYLAPRIEGFRGPLHVAQFRGGQSNPTYVLEAGGVRYVLRRKPPGKLLPSAHAVDREYRVMSALAGSDVPVPRTYLLCTDETVIGTAFFVMEHVDGRVLWDGTLPDQTKAERRAIYMEMNRVLAALHRVDFAARGLADFGKPGNYFERQIARWTKQYRASETERIEAMERLIEWLPRSIPEEDETAVVHGDFRLDNLIYHPTEARIVAVLDWELSTLGHPLADFSYHCMTFHLPPAPLHGIAGADPAALGIPTEDEYVEAYCRATGRAAIDPDHWRFYIAYNLFRGAGIAQGILGRVKDGTAASQHALAAGGVARFLAEKGWAMIGQR